MLDLGEQDLVQLTRTAQWPTRPPSRTMRLRGGHFQCKVHSPSCVIAAFTTQSASGRPTYVFQHAHPSAQRTTPWRLAHTGYMSATDSTSRSSPCSPNCSPRPPRQNLGLPRQARHVRDAQFWRRPAISTRIRARGLLPCADARPRDRCSISGPSSSSAHFSTASATASCIFCRRGIVPRRRPS